MELFFCVTFFLRIRSDSDLGGRRKEEEGVQEGFWFIGGQAHASSRTPWPVARDAFSGSFGMLETEKLFACRN
jgi:hypothetical protein